MVDVVQHKLFPTIVSEFEYNMSSDEHGIVLKELRLSKTRMIVQTQDDLHKKLPSFKRKVFEVTEKICRESKYRYDTLEVTGMWANMLKKGDSHPPHTHSNNVFSGVWYPCENVNTSRIHFIDPRPQANQLTPKRKKPNMNNGGVLRFNSNKDTMYMFPAWLMHWVPPTPNKRISISFNVILRGEYGEENTLQNANI